MQGTPNRMGLGMRPMYQGQGPPIGSLPPNGLPPPPGFVPYGQPPMGGAPGVGEKFTTLFVGSISAGITDEFLNKLFSACGPVRSLKRGTNPNGKPQGFGFVEFEEPDAVARAIRLLHGKTLHALEQGTPNKSLIVRADEKTKGYLVQYESQRMATDADDAADLTASTLVDALLEQTTARATAAGINPLTDAQAAVPPHLRDLQEGDLPENQRGLVISEIAQFRERAVKREPTDRRAFGLGPAARPGPSGAAPGAPRERIWGRSQQGGPPARTASVSSATSDGRDRGGFGNGAQGYQKPVGFVQGENAVPASGPEKTDEELERERQDERRQQEEASFRDRERRWESRENHRISNLQRTIIRERTEAANRERDREEMQNRLHVWDDDESDELFYTDRARWRSQRARVLALEREKDDRSRVLEKRQAEHLRQEAEALLERQMQEMQSLQEEQRKAGHLLDDGAPVRLSTATVSTSTKAGGAGASAIGPPKPAPMAVFGADDEEEEIGKKRKVPLVPIDFGGVEEAGRQERLEKVRTSVKKDKESLFKAKIRWDAMTDSLIDGKLEQMTRKKMIEYLGSLDDDDLIMFVSEHLKDHKPPSTIVEGLEPVLMEEAEAFVIYLWRQIVFESIAYGEGLETGDMLVE